MTTDDGFRLAQPPVKRVALTVNFKAEPALQGWHLDGFFGSVKERYLSREEVAPRPGFETGPFEFLSAEGGWPIPKTQFVGNERSLSLQGDELEVAWNFGGEGQDTYPGFESLMSELEQVLVQLVASADDHDVSVVPHSVECLYVNEIEDLTGGELAVGVLTNWSDVEARPVQEKGYVGVRLHGCGHTDEHPCSSYVMVDSDDGKAAALTFRVGRRLDQNEDAVKGVRLAHDELIGIFRSHTPEWLRRQWGES